MRTARIIQSGLFYHVTARVNHKEMLLRSPVAKKLFLEQLVRLRLRHDCEVPDFVVMENHVHLVVRPAGASGLGDIMKFLPGVYTMGYNRIHGTWGRFWGGRYFSRPILGLADLAATGKPEKPICQAIAWVIGPGIQLCNPRTCPNLGQAAPDCISCRSPIEAV